MFSQDKTTPVNADNTNAIQITTNPVSYDQTKHTKHIDVDSHTIKKASDDHVITLSSCVNGSSDLHISLDKDSASIPHSQIVVPGLS